MLRHASAIAIALLFNSAPVLAQSAPAPVSQLTVKGGHANVHKSPTVASAVIDKAPTGMVIEIRRNLGSWVEVAWPNTEKGIAFVHVSTGTIASRSIAGVPNPAEAQAAVAEITAVAAAATIHGRSDAGASGQMAANQSHSDPGEYVSLPTHHIGMGVLMNPWMPAFGATARTWWGHRLGAQFNIARPQLQSADGRVAVSTQFAPSVLYSLPEAVTSGLWVRPYLGAGPRFYRVDLATRVGYEAFGGAAATSAAMPQFALSADIGYRWSRASINGLEPRTIAFSLSGHWYVR